MREDLHRAGLNDASANYTIDAIINTPNAQRLWCDGINIERNMECREVYVPNDMYARALPRRVETVVKPSFVAEMPVNAPIATELAVATLPRRHDYDGDTISAVSYCPRIMTSEKGPVR